MMDMKEDRIRQIADSAWLLLASRVIALLIGPAFLGLFIWVWQTNTTLAVEVQNGVNRDRAIQNLTSRVDATQQTQIAIRETMARMDERTGAMVPALERIERRLERLENPQ